LDRLTLLWMYDNLFFLACFLFSKKLNEKYDICLILHLKPILLRGIVFLTWGLHRAARCFARSLFVDR